MLAGTLCCLSTSIRTARRPPDTVCTAFHWRHGGRPSPAESAEPPATLSTGVIPTMGLNDATEGTLLFRTGQPGRYLPAPILHTDANGHHGDHRPHDRHAEFTNPSTRKEDWLEGVTSSPSGNGCSRPAAHEGRGTNHRRADQGTGRGQAKV